MTDNGKIDTNLIPTWNGDPAKWKDYKKEVNFWRMSENMSVTQSLASKLILKLQGSARTAAMNMTEELLLPAADAAMRQHSGVDCMAAATRASGHFLERF